MERKVANFGDGRCGRGGGMWQGRGDVAGEGGCGRGGGMRKGREH